MSKRKISKEDCLSFLLSYLVVEQGLIINLDQMNLFKLSNLAATAEITLASTDGLIAHEIIEDIARQFIQESAFEESK